VRSRLPHVARFAVYAVVAAIGTHHLVNRDDASGAPPEPAGEWVRGVSTQGLPVSVKVKDHRAVVVDVTYRARCLHGVSTVNTHGFADRYDGDFKRDGQRFADEWTQSGAIENDQNERVTARLTGEAAGGIVRGSAHFTLEVLRSDQVVQRCEAGPVGFALDLP
jgi:hypothetical protein